MKDENCLITPENIKRQGCWEEKISQYKGFTLLDEKNESDREIYTWELINGCNIKVQIRAVYATMFLNNKDCLKG